MTRKMTAVLPMMWRSFEQKVIPTNASEGQRFDMESAFYAGALVMFEAMNAAAEHPEDMAVQLMDELHNDLERFRARVEAKNRGKLN